MILAFNPKELKQTRRTSVLERFEIKRFQERVRMCHARHLTYDPSCLFSINVQLLEVRRGRRMGTGTAVFKMGTNQRCVCHPQELTREVWGSSTERSNESVALLDNFVYMIAHSQVLVKVHTKQFH